MEPLDLRNTKEKPEERQEQEIHPERVKRAEGSPRKEPRKRLSVGEKIVGGVAIIIVLFAFYITLDANKYSATVYIIEGQGRVGVNPTTELLDFGDLSPGTSAIRRIEIINGTGIPMYVFVIRFGSITDLMELNKNFFVLPGGETEKIEFSVYMPASAPIDKTLNGRVFLFKIPGPWSS